MNAAQRRLIVNADDFGQSLEVTEGIVAAHVQGIVTSTSLMVRGRAVEAAVRAARAHPALGVGIHLDLGEWFYRDEAWWPLYEVVPLDDPALVAREIDRQVQAFVDLMGRPPTHLDSHQHVHRRESVRPAAEAAAARLGVPLRHFTAGVTYCGGFYGQTERGEPWPAGIEVSHLVALIEGLGDGTTELACHPGLGAGGESIYDAERAEEVRTLCDPRVRDAIERGGITPVTFAEAGDPGSTASGR